MRVLTPSKVDPRITQYGGVSNPCSSPQNARGFMDIHQNMIVVGVDPYSY